MITHIVCWSVLLVTVGAQITETTIRSVTEITTSFGPFSSSSLAPSNGSCGGHFTGRYGLITSPNFPYNYPDRQDCGWLITAPASHTVNLTFLSFNYEGSLGCVFDYVAVYDGPSSSSSLSIKHCGPLLPYFVSYKSTSNQMYVRMSTDASISGKGFKAVYTSENTGCGGELFGEAGLLTSPKYPDNYPHDMDCSWLITVPAEHVVFFTFVDLEIESDLDCRYDSVSLYDGSDNISPLLVKKCGSSSSPQPYQSSNNKMFVHMVSDGSVSFRGFKARYSVNDSSCGGELTEDLGTVTSPNYPNVYPDDILCTWVITAPITYSVNLTFHDFHIENSTSCLNDYVKIYDGSSDSPLAELCGTHLPVSYETTSNQMNIVLFTDESGSGTGFFATYTFERNCFNELSGETGEFTSPNYPEIYPNAIDCTWLITVPASETVYLTFTYFDLEGSSACSYDYVSIYDGESASSPLLRKGCGRTITNHDLFESSTNQMFVYMHTDDTVGSFGFKAKFSVNNTRCGATLLEKTGVLTSPNYPNPYPPNSSCTWLITVPESHVVNLTFLDFDIENSTSCIDDYVAVYDGSSIFQTEIAKLCGDELPNPVSYLSTFDDLFVHMISDGSGTAAGFNAKYTIEGCFSELSEDSGVFTSPNYPSNYIRSTDCGWLISVPDSESVYLTFLDFEIHTVGFFCTSNYVALYDGANSSSPLITKECGSLLPTAGTYQSSSNHMYVRMVTDFIYPGKGFRAMYSVDRSDSSTNTCGGDLSETSGVLTSLNYPDNYPSKSSCRWLITAPFSQSVYLTFLDIDIENSDNCADGYVAVHNGQNTLAPLIVKHCGTMLPSPASYKSTENKMYVHVFAYGSGTGTGFKAMYIFKECGDQLSGETGVFTSQNYPEEYPDSIECSWLITVPAPGIVYLTFLDFELESSSTCDYDYIEVFDGVDGSWPLLMKECGTSVTISDSYQSSSNQMYVRMKTDSSYALRGFKARYSVNSSYCGGTLTEETGFLTSPNYPNNYPADISCTWLITAPVGHWVDLTFLEFDIENSTSCIYDYLMVYDGSNISSTLIADLCGTELPNPISYESSFSNMFVHMFADGTGIARGFKAMYSFESCGSELSGDSGILTSLNYPSNYLPSKDCRWLITVPDSETVYLTIVDFDVNTMSPSCMNDYVALHDGVNTSSPLIAKACGSSLPTPVTYQSSSNQMFVRMKTHSDDTGKGFMARYSANSSDSLNETCGGEIFDQTGFITSPNYPNKYPNDRSCRWLITGTAFHSVHLTFLDFDIPDSDNCTGAYVAVYDGHNALTPLLVKHCGAQLPSPEIYQSTSNQMYVHMFDFGSVTGRGFKVMYSITSCGATFRSRTGVIMGMIVPEPFYHNPDCNWLIRVESGRQVIFSFTDFAVGASYVDLCPDESVVIYDGGDVQNTEMMRHCGNSLPSDNTYTSTSNHLFIRMRASRSTVGTGFTAEYRSSAIRCGRRGERTSNSRIIGGYEATINDAPWQVAIYEVSKTGISTYICGGTIISESWILSAAHCFDEQSVDYFNVTVGHLRRDKYDEGQQSFAVSSFMQHEEYNPVTYDYDICVAKVKPFDDNVIQFNEYVEPACLPSSSSSYTSENICYVSGWGRTETGETYELRETNITLVDEQICNDADSYNGRITPRMFCAGSKGFDTCSGDSGGPLVCSEDDQYTVYGVTSWGEGCAEENFPGVYADVRYLIDWIKEKTGL